MTGLPGRSSAFGGFALAGAFITALSAFGCGDNAAPDEPEGGLEAFIVALSSGEPERVYDQLSDDTRALCEDAVVTLRDTADAIQLLQPSDQIDARRNTGVELLQRVESGADLFAQLTDLTAIPPLDEGSRFRTGLKPSTTVPVAADTVLIATKSGQEFELVRDADGMWRVREPMYGLLTSALGVVHGNRERVDDAIRLFGAGMEIDDELRELGLLD